MTERIVIDPSSIIPLADFPLGWRFEARRHSLPEAALLSRIKPLDAATATRIAGVVERERDSRAALIFRSDETPGAVRRQLIELPIPNEASVVLSWNGTTALLTDWAIFVLHWDDFCYPASDEVTIRPLDGEWTLRYRRYEVFQFWLASQAGATLPTAADRPTS